MSLSKIILILFCFVVYFILFFCLFITVDKVLNDIWEDASAFCRDRYSYLPSLEFNPNYSGWIGLSFYFLMRGSNDKGKYPVFRSKKVYFKSISNKIHTDYILCEIKEKENATSFTKIIIIVVPCVIGLLIIFIIVCVIIFRCK